MIVHDPFYAIRDVSQPSMPHRYLLYRLLSGDLSLFRCLLPSQSTLVSRSVSSVHTNSSVNNQAELTQSLILLNTNFACLWAILLTNLPL